MNKTSIRNALFITAGSIFVIGLIIAGIQLILNQNQVPYLGIGIAVLGFLAIAAVGILQQAEVF